MSRPRLLDLFCGAGGAAMGYHRAGFDVIGVDIDPQPHYPFECYQWDALDWLDSVDAAEFAAIHASPPCQLHSTQKTGVTGRYQDLIEPTRSGLRATGLPYVIENVVGAPLVDPVMLCGTSMGCVDGDTDLTRHRLFESNVLIMATAACAHDRRRRTLGVYGDLSTEDRPNRPITERNPSHRGWKAGKARARRLMGIDWEVTDRELAEAIPPAYTEWIGRQLIGFVA